MQLGRKHWGTFMDATISRYTHTLEQYQLERQQFFGTLNSLRWFVARHKRELVAGGAYIQPVKSYLIDPARFDAVVADVGQRQAEQAAA
jgi:hypothetical protein